MRRSRSLAFLLSLTGSIAVGVTVVAPAAASAAPLAVAPLGESAGSAAELARWAPRCWWRQTPWGPRQECRRVWVEPRRWGYEGEYRHDRHRRDWDDHGQREHWRGGGGDWR